MLILNTIYNGDCLELMKEIDNYSINAIICDLPYGVTNNKLDIIIPFEPLWEHYKRIIKDDGIIILFAQGIFYVDLVNSNRKMFRYDLVWDKVLTSGFLNAKRMPLRQHEQIAIFYNKKPIYNPQMTEGKPSHKKGTLFKHKEVVNNNYGKFKQVETDTSSTLKYPTSIIKFKKPHPSVAKHRTEKPVQLLEWLIKTYTKEGDVILDNCCGSGTTCVAALNTKRNFIGIEKDENYFNIAQQRIHDYLSD